jgi:hypothetical protein
MRAPRQGLALAAASAALVVMAGAASAVAAEPGPDTLPINVIAVQTDDADDQAEALTKALRNAVRAMPGWSLGEGDFSLEVITLSLKCSTPPDANCQSRIADQIKSDRYVWGSIGKKGQNVTGTLNFWVRGKGNSKIPIEYTANLTESTDDTLRKIASGAINELTGGPPKGGIHVRAGSVAGQVFIDGQPLGALKDGDGSFMIPSGPHKVTVKAQGYADAETQAVVKPTGAPTEVTLVPLPMENKSPVNVKRVIGFGAIGVGVGLGVGGLISSLKVNSARTDPAYDTYRHNLSKSSDVCAAAASGKDPAYPMGTDNKGIAIKNGNIDGLCSSAKTAQTLQLVFYPLAAVAAGLGVFLVATSGGGAAKKPTTGFQFDPKIGPQGGKLDVTYTW